MGAKKLPEKTNKMEKFKLYTMDEVAHLTTYDRRTIDRFSGEGTLKTRKLNGGRRVTTMKWIMEFLNSLSDDGPLEF